MNHYIDSWKNLKSCLVAKPTFISSWNVQCAYTLPSFLRFVIKKFFWTLAGASERLFQFHRTHKIFVRGENILEEAFPVTYLSASATKELFLSLRRNVFARIFSFCWKEVAHSDLSQSGFENTTLLKIVSMGKMCFGQSLWCICTIAVWIRLFVTKPALLKTSAGTWIQYANLLFRKCSFSRLSSIQKVFSAVWSEVDIGSCIFTPCSDL